MFKIGLYKYSALYNSTYKLYVSSDVYKFYVVKD